jgi:hypothetical protein
VDLHERRELDMSAHVAKVRARARPWRSIIALVLALAGLAAGEFGHYGRHLDGPTRAALNYGGAAVFLLFGLIAVFGLSGQVRGLLQPAIGAAHAGVARYALVLLGLFSVLLITLNMASLPVGQLVVGGAVTGVLLGIAAQQSLANLFAGMVLLFARPFRVGDHVRFRAGALSGTVEGTVTDVSITYVRLETSDGLVFIPNSQALAATVGPISRAPEPDPAANGSAASAPDAGLAAVAGAAAASAVAAILGDPSGPAGAAQAGHSQPGLSQPGLSQPGLSQPGLSQPGLSQPAPSQAAPSQAAPSQAGLNQAGLNQAGLNQAGLNQAGLNQAGLNQAGLNQAGTGQPGTPPAGSARADSARADPAQAAGAADAGHGPDHDPGRDGSPKP